MQFFLLKGPINTSVSRKRIKLWLTLDSLNRRIKALTDFLFFIPLNLLPALLTGVRLNSWFIRLTVIWFPVICCLTGEADEPVSLHSKHTHPRPHTHTPRLRHFGLTLKEEILERLKSVHHTLQHVHFLIQEQPRRHWQQFLLRDRQFNTTMTQW